MNTYPATNSQLVGEVSTKTSSTTLNLISSSMSMNMSCFSPSVSYSHTHSCSLGSLWLHELGRPVIHYTVYSTNDNEDTICLDAGGYGRVWEYHQRSPETLQEEIAVMWIGMRHSSPLTPSWLQLLILPTNTSFTKGRNTTNRKRTVCMYEWDKDLIGR